MDTIASIYRQRGQSDYIGEPITQLQHALQAGFHAFNAVVSRVREPGDVDYDSQLFVMACLLHDIGHLLTRVEVSELDLMRDDDGQSLGVKTHERVGAKYLAKLGLAWPVPSLVGSHVDAKRYLVSIDPDHLNKLSSASRATLNLQGGPMSEDEQRVFSSHPLCRDKVLLRRCDEKAKETEVSYEDLDLTTLWATRKILTTVPTLESYLKWFSETGCC